MPHKSDDAKPLAVCTHAIARASDFPRPDPSSPDVWFFILPFGRTLQDTAMAAAWFDRLRNFVAELHSQSVLTIVTTAEDAAATWTALSASLRFQLWVAIKLRAPRSLATITSLPQSHAALLVLSKYEASLRHSKTRIAYTYCPACDRTTKDYGGKKHTYHEYGTLISDVWRDIVYEPGTTQQTIIERLRDLFGVAPHQTLRVADFTRWKTLKPSQVAPTAVRFREELASPLRSKLVCGDSISTLRTLPTNSVDFCFADPPYNLAKRYDTWNDAIELRDYFTWCDLWLDELARVLRPGRTCAVLNIPLWAIRHFQHLQRTLSFQNWIVWEGLSLPVRMIMPAHYSILCFSKGPPRTVPGLSTTDRPHLESAALSPLAEDFCVRATCVQRRNGQGRDRTTLTDLWWDIHRLKHNSRRVDHPCQLPPALMRRLIALFTNERELVLDPFNGAGTTTLCAAELGREYIGIELSERYHQLATGRHDLLRRGGDPFEKTRGVPQAKNNLVKRIGQTQYQVPKKTLQLDVRRIARALGRLPTREEVARLSHFPLRFFEEYFVSWGEVCAAARTTGMTEHRPERLTKTIHQPTLFD